VLRRAALIVDLSIETEFIEDQIVELVNPEIIDEVGEQTGSEGCLSVPGVYGIVTRPGTVRVRAQDRFGRLFEFEGSELTARAICHECDHLNGIIFTSLAERLLTAEELAAEKEAAASEAKEAGSENTCPHKAEDKFER
jgi:peptide deformylase